MAKVYPQLPTSPQTQCLTSKRETYTLWLKSLVFHSNGCTVYDSNGDIVYRVDNYDRKGRREVNLMDLRGKVLCTIKKVQITQIPHPICQQWLKPSHCCYFSPCKSFYQILMTNLFLLTVFCRDY